MKGIIGWLLAALLLTGCVSNTGSSGEASAEAYVSGRWATVTDVADGDTLELNGKEKVRLIGVNTPETVKPNTEVQPYGNEASEYTKKHLQGKKVFVEVDVEPTDRYGRTLAYVYTEAPKSEADVEAYMFNATLLREGYAQLMTIQPNVKYQELFLRLQRTAREANTGLWALGIYKDAAKSTNDVFLNSTTTDCGEPRIKGNRSSKGEKIYHIPGGTFYDRTQAEEMFCTEQAAIDAGYRKSKQ